MCGMNLTKEYPLRPQKYHSSRYQHICECGHEDINHKVSPWVKTSYPPQYDYLDCEICMCQEYKQEKTYEERLPL